MKRLRLVLFFALLAIFTWHQPGIAGVTVHKQVHIPVPGATPAGACTLNVTLQNGSYFLGSYPSGTDSVSFDQYLKVEYSSSLPGFNAIIISTDNSSAESNFKYTGGGDGAGLVYTDDTAINAALHWVVFDAPQTPGYQFVAGDDPNAEPVRTSNQFFVVDKKVGSGSFPAGYASVIYDINNFSSQLAAAPIANRTTQSGTVYIYLGANVKFYPTGIYRTNTLKVQLVTIADGQITEINKSSAPFSAFAVKG